MNKEDAIFQIADSQQGYFTSQQAENCGYQRSHFHQKIASGEWARELRGIYRLVRYPIIQRPELVLWSLWSRNKKGEPQGIWSHETALDIHEISDVMPKKMHLSVPSKFRKRAEIPKLLCLHYLSIPKSDTELHQGYRVTTAFRTIMDVIQEGKVPSEQIANAIRDATRKGLISQKELRQLKEYYVI